MAREHHNVDHYSAIQEARLQLFIDFAEDRYLNRLASNLGIDRPLGHSDDLFRALVKQTALTRHSVLKIFTDVLDLLVGPSKSRVFELSEDLPIGSSTMVVTSTGGLPQVGILRIDPETSREETVEYVYVDYLTNTVWLKEPTTILHLSKQPKTTIQDDVLVGDDFADLVEPDLFPQGAFLATIDRGGPNEEMVFILSRGVGGSGGNRVYRTGEFQLSQGRELVPTGELVDVAHKAGETFEWAGSVNIPGRLVADVSAGDLTIAVEAIDAAFPVDKSFPADSFFITLSPGTPHEETIQVITNDRAVPTSTFTVKGFTSTLTGYNEDVDLDVTGGDELVINSVIPPTSTFEVVIDRGTPTEETVLVKHLAGTTYTIVSDSSSNPGPGSTIEFPVVIANDHLAGSAVSLSGPGNSVLTEYIEANDPVTTNTSTFKTTRVDRFPEGPPINPTSPYTEYSIIINQGEHNEDIVGMEASDKSADTMVILTGNEDALAHDHYPGEPVRPATIVMDGTGWQIRERDHKVDILIPEVNIPDNRLRDASYLHHDGLLSYVESGTVPVGGDDLSDDVTIIPVDVSAPRPDIEEYKSFPEVGMLLISDGVVGDSEYIKYESKRMTSLAQSTVPVGTVTSVADIGGGTITAIRLLINGYGSRPDVFPNPTLTPFQVEAGPTIFTVTEVEFVSNPATKHNVKLTVVPAVSGVTSGDNVRILGIKVLDPTVVLNTSDLVHVESGSTPLTVSSIQPSTGWVLTTALPDDDLPTDSHVYQDPLGFKISTSDRFINDPGIEARALNTSLLLAGKRYEQTVNNVGDQAPSTVVLQANVSRGATNFDVNPDFGTAFGLGDPILGSMVAANTGSSSGLTVEGISFPDSVVGQVVVMDPGSSMAGSIRTIDSLSSTYSDNDTLSFAVNMTAPALSTDEFSIYEFPVGNIIIDEGGPEEIRTTESLSFDPGGNYTLGIRGGLVYDHVGGQPVKLAGPLLSDVDSSDTYNINTDFTGPNMFDETKEEIRPDLVTSLVDPIASSTILASAAAPPYLYAGGVDTSFDILDKGNLLPASPARFNVILAPNTIREELLEVTLTATGVVGAGEFVDSATLTITDGDVMTYDHFYGDEVVFLYDSITVADSSNLPLTSGKLVLDFGYSNQEVVRYLTNNTSTGTLTLTRTEIFDEDHATTGTVDLSSLFSVPDVEGDADPFYLPPNPYAKLEFWIELAKAAGICINFTSIK